MLLPREGHGPLTDPCKRNPEGNPLEMEMVWFLVLNLEILKYGIEKKREMQGGKSWKPKQHPYLYKSWQFQDIWTAEEAKNTNQNNVNYFFLPFSEHKREQRWVKLQQLLGRAGNWFIFIALFCPFLSSKTHRRKKMGKGQNKSVCLVSFTGRKLNQAEKSPTRSQWLGKGPWTVAVCFMTTVPCTAASLCICGSRWRNLETRKKWTILQSLFFL